MNLIRKALPMAFLLLFAGGCSGLFLHPDRGYADLSYLNGYTVERVEVAGADGTTLRGLSVANSGSPQAGTVVFFHGNAQNVSTHLKGVVWLADAGYRILAVDYRGYGLSDGEAKLAGVNEDARSILEWALADPSLGGRGVFVLGQSLGGALALYAVAKSPARDRVDLIVVDSAFSSYRRIFREKVAATVIGWPVSWPLGFTVNDEFSPERTLPLTAGVPILFIHATGDPVVGFSHSERLFELASEPKGFWTVRGGGHTAAFELPQVRENLLRVMRERRK